MILTASHVGFPLSTTQVVLGAVAGAGVGRPGAVVNWLVARNIGIGCLLWRANRAKPVEPEETISERAAFGPVAQPEPVVA